MFKTPKFIKVSALFAALLMVFTTPAVTASTETGIGPVTQAKVCVPPILEKWMVDNKDGLHGVYTDAEMTYLYQRTFGKTIPKDKYDEIKVYSKEEYRNVIYIGFKDGCYVNQTNKVLRKGYFRILDEMKGKKKVGPSA